MYLYRTFFGIYIFVGGNEKEYFLKKCSNENHDILIIGLLFVICRKKIGHFVLRKCSLFIIITDYLERFIYIEPVLYLYMHYSCQNVDLERKFDGK